MLKALFTVVSFLFLFFTYLNNVLRYGFFSRVSSPLLSKGFKVPSGTGAERLMAGIFDKFEFQVELRCNTAIYEDASVRFHNL